MAGSHSSDMRLGDASATDLAFNDVTTTDNSPWVEIDLDIGFILTLFLSDTVTITDNSSRVLGGQSQAPRSMHQFRQRRI
jgi:hypothetical protein